MIFVPVLLERRQKSGRMEQEDSRKYPRALAASRMRHECPPAMGQYTTGGAMQRREKYGAFSRFGSLVHLRTSGDANRESGKVIGLRRSEERRQHCNV